MVLRRLASVRHFEKLGRWEERLLLWKVRDEEWVVTALDGRAHVEELLSWVDAAPFSGKYNRRVVGDVLHFIQWLMVLLEKACFRDLAPSPIRIKRPEVNLLVRTTSGSWTLSGHR